MNVMEKTAKVDVIAYTLHTAHQWTVNVLKDGEEQVVMKVSQIIFSIPIIYLNIYLLYIYIYIYIYIYMCVCIYKYKEVVNWPTMFEDNTKAPFLIVIGLGCMGGCYSLPQIAPLILDQRL